MSNKERIMQLINTMPDNKLIFVVNILEEMKAYAGEAIEPDEWDLAMIEEARAENDGSTMTLDEVCRELGVKL